MTRILRLSNLKHLWGKLCCIHTYEECAHPVSRSAITLNDSRFSTTPSDAKLPADSDEWIRQLTEKIKKELKLNQKTFPSLKKNVDILRKLNFSEVEIQNLVMKCKNLCRYDKTKEILGASLKLESFGVKPSELGSRFIHSFDRVYKGKSDEILSFLRERLGPQDFIYLVKGQHIPLYWKLEDLKRKIEIVESAGIKINRSFFFRSFMITASSISRNLKGLIDVFGKREAVQIVGKNPCLLRVPPETARDSFEYLKSVFGKEEAKNIIISYPSLVALTPKKSEEVICGLSGFFGGEGTIQMIKKNPVLLIFVWKTNVLPKIEFFLYQMERDKGEIIKSPIVFNYSLEKRIIPRYEQMQKSGVDSKKFDLATLLWSNDLKLQLYLNSHKRKFSQGLSL